jgi:hypothetical protein
VDPWRVANTSHDPQSLLRLKKCGAGLRCDAVPAGRAGANSVEFDASTPHPAVVFMPEVSKTHMGGTMRLGSRATVLQTMDCLTAKLYRVGAACVSVRAQIIGASSQMGFEESCAICCRQSITGSVEQASGS